MSRKDTKWFTDARFGMFIHWGLYAIPGGIWKGTEMDYIGEWIQSRFRIPNAEYAELAKSFNPVKFNADEWIRMAKEAGVKYIVFTTKHHDGFAMYHSKVDPYNIVDATPFGRDPLRELADACGKYGIRLGIYYSHYLDWHEPDAGDPGPDAPKNAGSMSWANDWDYPDYKNKNFGRYFEKKVVPQLTELFSNYGRISVIWFDCAGNIEKKYCERLVELIHSLQPECLINSRIGNKMGDYGSLGDNQRPLSTSEFPLESPVTLNRTWGFKWADEHWKSAESAVSELVAAASKNTNYLLNIGPRPDGDLPGGTKRFFADLVPWIQNEGRHLFGSKPNPFPQELSYGWCLANGNKLFFYIRDWKSEITVSGIRNRVSGASVEWKQDGNTLILTLPERPESLLPMIEVELDGAPDIEQILMPQNGILDLTVPKGVIHHGASELLLTKEAELGPASEKLVQAGHSIVEAYGLLSQWHNPADSIEWEIAFPKGGTYEVLTNTQRRWSHGNPWCGGRSVEAVFNGQICRNELEETRFTGDFHKCAALSRIGEITVKNGETGMLSLRTLDIFDKEALGMTLASVLLIQK